MYIISINVSDGQVRPCPVFSRTDRFKIFHKIFPDKPFGAGHQNVHTSTSLRHTILFTTPV